MKRTIALMLCVLALLSFSACGGDETEENLVITRGAVEETQALTGEDAEAVSAEPFVFVAEGVELLPGAAFDPALLGEASSVYQVPSCAIEGTDNVYNYDAFEVTAYDDGTGEVIYSIYFVDPELTTPEGLALGDGTEKVLELYGQDYVEEGTAWVYTRGNTQLKLILQNETVVSIEYLMCT